MLCPNIYSRFIPNFCLTVIQSLNLWQSQLLVSCIVSSINLKFLRLSHLELIRGTGQTDGQTHRWHATLNAALQPRAEVRVMSELGIIHSIRAPSWHAFWVYNVSHFHYGQTCFY